MKILAFGASNSSKSINKQLATWAATQVEGAEITILDLNDFEMPIYSEDRERENGIPEKAILFSNEMGKADAIIISLAEHNGAYTTAFKNIFDWCSRIPGRSVFQDKALFLLATSNGARGASTVLEIAANRFPYNGGKVAASFSLPQFSQNFDPERGITHPEELEKFELAKSKWIDYLNADQE